MDIHRRWKDSLSSMDEVAASLNCWESMMQCSTTTSMCFNYVLERDCGFSISSTVAIAKHNRHELLEIFESVLDARVADEAGGDSLRVLPRPRAQTGAKAGISSST